MKSPAWLPNGSKTGYLSVVGSTLRTFDEQVRRIQIPGERKQALQFELRPPDGFYASVFLPMLGKDFELRIWPEMDEDLQRDLPAPTRHQLAIANEILQLGPEFLDEVDNAAEAWRQVVDDSIDLSKYDLGHINRNNIRDHYEIHTIIVAVHQESADRCFLIGAGCDWEYEHGMAIYVRNGAITNQGEDSFNLNCNYWSCANEEE